MDSLLSSEVSSGVSSRSFFDLSENSVNTSLNDLKNQIRFISLDDDKAFSETMQIPSIEGAIKVANKKYVEWSKDDNRDKNELLNNLNANFFKLLEELTIARSRKHIKHRYRLCYINEPSNMGCLRTRWWI